jgi:hypothetical protein
VEALEHGAAPGGSKNRVKVTVPVGVGPPAVPVTVAVSVTVSTVVAVPGGAAGLEDAARVTSVGTAWMVTFSPGAPHGVVGTGA